MAILKKMELESKQTSVSKDQEEQRRRKMEGFRESNSFCMHCICPNPQKEGHQRDTGVEYRLCMLVACQHSFLHSSKYSILLPSTDNRRHLLLIGQDYGTCLL